ncbi:caspase family protein [Streptomyces sp. IMTB 2501]|uniref:caspase family protein n=1 Tax=Streptomyces sp. IMTB 2501 TaxID=1776340 RepID=UPI00117E14C4|nr:caspase family protein [Streptomyces sp. IMTB 2501]
MVCSAQRAGCRFVRFIATALTDATEEEVRRLVDALEQADETSSPVMSAVPDPALSRAVLAGVSCYSKLESLPAVANNLKDLAAVLMSPLSWELLSEYCTVVAEFLMDSRAQRHVIILDCCMSGRALGMMSGQDLLADQAEVDGSYLLAASPETGLALAPPGETHTAFTGELLRLVREGIPGPARELDLDVIYQRLRRELAERGGPVPQRRARSTAGRIIFADNIAFDPAAAARAQRATEALWPEPADCHTPRAFIGALAVVRAVSGHTIQEVSQRATPPVSPGTISALLNRTTMPRSWKATGIYLEACGLPREEADAWQAAWQRLLLSEQARPTPSQAPVPSARRSRRTRLIRKKPGSR